MIGSSNENIRVRLSELALAFEEGAAELRRTANFLHLCAAEYDGEEDVDDLVGHEAEAFRTQNYVSATFTIDSVVDSFNRVYDLCEAGIRKAQTMIR